MKMKNKLRSATELTVSMTIIATLLAGCFGGGGGGGGTTAATTGATTPVTVVPSKGKFADGAHVRIRDDNGSYTAYALTLGGSAVVAVPVTFTPPFLIEAGVKGDSYYDITKAAFASMVSAAPVRALVPDLATLTAASGVGVNFDTESVIARIEKDNPTAMTTTGLGKTLAASAVVTASTMATAMGYASYKDLFVPATPYDGTAKLDPTKSADAKSLKFEAMARAASGVGGADLLDDIKIAARNSATSGVAGALPGFNGEFTKLTTGTLSVTGAASAVAPTLPPVISAASMASAVTTIAANTTSTSNFLTDLTTTGLREFQPGLKIQWANASGVATTQTNYATGRSISATLANGVYTVIQSIMELVNKVWTAIAPTSNNAGTNYVLTATGWVDDKTLPVTFTTNADGTATATNMNGIPGNSIVAVSAIDITGTMSIASAVGFVDANGFMSNINASGVQATSAVAGTITFPAGSRKYLLNNLGASTADNYQVWTSAAWSNDVRDPAGIIPGSTTLATMLSTHTTAANPICINGWAFVAQAATLATATPTADVYFQQWNPATNQSTCAAITTTGPTAQTSMGTVVMTSKTVNGQTLGISTAGTFTGMMNNSFIANVNGSYRSGTFYPAGTPLVILGGGNANLVNKKAADAAMTALGFPAL